MAIVGTSKNGPLLEVSDTAVSSTPTTSNAIPAVLEVSDTVVSISTPTTSNAIPAVLLSVQREAQRKEKQRLVAENAGPNSKVFVSNSSLSTIFDYDYIL